MTESLNRITPFRDDIKALPFIVHINAYLQAVADKKIGLTKTGNINLAAIKMLAEFIPLPDFKIEYTIRSEDHWPYLMFIDAICQLAKLTQNRVGKKGLLKMGKEFLASSPESQLLLSFQAFMEQLDWQYLIYREAYQNPVVRLQKNKINCLLLLYDINHWIDLTEFCDFVLDKVMEPNRDAGKSVILNVFLEKLEMFGLVEMQMQSDYPVTGNVRLSQLGRAVSQFIFEQIGIPNFDEPTPGGLPI